MIEHIKMTPSEWFKSKIAIRNFSRQYGLPAPVARTIFQQLIDEAWERAWQPNNIREQINWQKLFPADRRPTVEEYIVTIAREQEAGKEPLYLL